MKPARLLIRYAALIVAVHLFGFAQASESPQGKDYASPVRFETAIQAFEAKDRKTPPPSGAIVCIGSSTIRMWHATIVKDLAPLTVIPRGFGGGQMNHALHYRAPRVA